MLPAFEERERCKWIQEMPVKSHAKYIFEPPKHPRWITNNNNKPNYISQCESFSSHFLQKEAFVRLLLKLSFQPTYYILLLGSNQYYQI